MKLLFISNFLNHHQTPVSDELFRFLGENYGFISTQSTPKEFLKSGYPNCENYEYNILAYLNHNNLAKAQKLTTEADIVIFGSCAIPELLQIRLKTGKPFFKYSERIFKKCSSYLFLPYHLLNGNYWRSHISLRHKPVYLLCAGAYVANDFSLISAYQGKMYKWGYFTKNENIDILKLLDEKKKIIKKRLLWVGRFIDWKHPELPIKLAHNLKIKGYDFQLDMIGGGYLEKHIKKLILDLKVEDCVNLLGNMPNEMVLQKMRKSNIFLFTSDRQEGWGAPLNEAMSNGCAVVASNMIGAVPFLLEKPETGLIFNSGNLKSLQSEVEKLLDDPVLTNSIAYNAYNEIVNVWSPSNAAKNLLELCTAILNNKTTDITILNGPCSKAYTL